LLRRLVESARTVLSEFSPWAEVQRRSPARRGSLIALD
jgi:hypothetical protein